MKLSFLIAGVQKGGTSALHSFLKQHPQLFLPGKKELHFFDNDEFDWTAPEYNKYHRHFQDAPVNHLLGEATPIYIYWRHSLKRIHQYNPNIKLIISLRHPIERAYSHWRMETRRNYESAPFSYAIRQGRQRIKTDPDGGGFHRVFSYVERGFYTEQLNRVYSLFPQNQVLLVSQHLLKSRHRETLDEICDFLNIHRFKTYPLAEEVFADRSSNTILMSEQDLTLLKNTFASELESLKQLYDIDFPEFTLDKAGLPGSDKARSPL